MTVLTLAERIVALHRSFDRGGVPHAFGGALALAYHTDKVRATKDIDVNVFVPPERAEQVLRSLPDSIAWTDDEVALVERDGQVRLWWDDTPVDLFFDQHEIHRRAQEHGRSVPFRGIEIPILGSTELTVFKMLFSRPQDWVDIRAMLDARSVDVEAVSASFARIMGQDDEALVRFHAIADEARA